MNEIVRLDHSSNSEEQKYLGKLYLCTEIQDSAAVKQNRHLFDTKTGNVHILPYDVDLARSCSDAIQEKLEKISDYLKDIKVRKRRVTGSLLAETSHKDAGHLFDYLRVYGKNTNYDLVFNRFFIDINNRVNCILLSLQVEMFNNTLRGSEPREDPPYTKKYPHTPHNGEGNDCYYNLDVDFNSEAKDIAEKFLKFVQEKETGKASLPEAERKK